MSTHLKIITVNLVQPTNINTQEDIRTTKRHILNITKHSLITEFSINTKIDKVTTT